MLSASRGTRAPEWILRHHSPSPIHASCFCIIGKLQFVLAGDEEGQVSVTALQDRRPRYFWQAHEKSILAIDLLQDKDNTVLLSQGRDNKLCMWKLSKQHTLPSLSVLPSRIQQDLPVPELVRSIDINALNYCPMSVSHSANVLAITHTIDSGYVDVLELPSCRRILRAIGKPDVRSREQRAPMCMTIHLLASDSQTVSLLAGYEDGYMRLWSHTSVNTESSNLIWATRQHTESVMSSAVCQRYAFSVAADNQLVRYHLTDGTTKITTCNSTGNASITVRQDGKFVAIGGWDGTVRVFDVDLQHVASLRYHKDTVQTLNFCTESDIVLAGDLLESSDDENDGDHKHSSPCNLVSGGKEGRLCLWTL